ncbi:MAG TPA: ammonia-forming cytochrome c nitrite reductase subunit c552 [Thermoguttaceae bacterium]|nr:ammonia-forming cytochrome c nitrite reductase subunit c552 [Thermoguttaceae bacterium]
MKHAAWLVSLVGLAVFALVYVADFSRDDARAVAAPPLSLDGLLDEKLPEAPKEKEKLKVDNFACYVCHGNYDGEELVVSHGKEGTGCIDCHGKSYAHRNDEDNVTPPDKMYPLDAVDKMCADCHDEHIASARKVIERWQERCPEKADPKGIVCTDCHYQHRLQRRTVVWNKKTGEVILREKKKEETTKAPAAEASKTGG